MDSRVEERRDMNWQMVATELVAEEIMLESGQTELSTGSIMRSYTIPG
jgi:hypothetical protein